MLNSMTGDGAVVREWRAEGRWPTVWCDGKSPSCFELTEEHNALARHALAQAAEIERLTGELRAVDQAFARRPALDSCKTRADMIYKMCEAAGNTYRAEKATEASEARTADLLKAVGSVGTAVKNGTWGGGSENHTSGCLAVAKGETV